MAAAPASSRRLTESSLALSGDAPAIKGCARRNPRYDVEMSMALLTLQTAGPRACTARRATQGANGKRDTVAISAKSGDKSTSDGGIFRSRCEIPHKYGTVRHLGTEEASDRSGLQRWPASKGFAAGARMLSRVLLSGLLVAAVSIAVAGQRPPNQLPSLIDPSLYGPDIFQFYCASCHGRDGTGDGPVASVLKVRPPDLTKLTSRNGGRFPRERVEAFVTHGRTDAPAHGSTDMPVWGPTFRALDPSDSLVKIRIENVVAYVESIQTK